MARLFDDANSQYLVVDSAPVVAVPLSMSIWFNTDKQTLEYGLNLTDASDTDQQFAILIGTNSTTDNTGNGDRVGAVAYNNNLSVSKSTAGYSIGVWSHGCAVFPSSIERIAYLNGGNAGNGSTASRTPAAIDRLSISGARDLTPGFYFSGSLAEAAIWNIALTAAEVAILGAGYSPLFVRPQNLVFYVPLIRDDDEDIVGGLSLSTGDTPTVSAHPRIIRPAG